MIITREIDYAVRILRKLWDRELHTVGEISQEELVPQPFAYKILKKLAQAGYVDIFRGPKGGIRLGTGDFREISLYDLIEALGESTALNACMDPAYACEWEASHGESKIHGELKAIQDQLDDTLRSHSLWELLSGDDGQT